MSEVNLANERTEKNNLQSIPINFLTFFYKMSPGVFVVLVVGCIASIFITCFEIILHSRDARPSQGVTDLNEINYSN